MTFKEWVRAQFEIKKVNLLHTHRKKNRRDEEKRLVTEINVIAELLDQPRINVNNIAGTLRVYPNLIKEV